MNPNIIYGLIDPRTLMVRYVGQSRCGMGRTLGHKYECQPRFKNHKANWLRQLISLGLQYDVVILQESSRQSLDDDERWWIAYGRALGWPLTNLTKGGNGDRTYSVALGQRMSEGQKRRWARGGPELQKLLANLVPRVRGQKLPPEITAKIAAANRGRRASSRAIAKMREAWQRRRVRENAMGIVRSHSEEAKAKISAANKGRPPAAHTIAAALAARDGKPAWNKGVTGVFHHTAETATKIGEASRTRKRSPEEITKSANARRGAKRSEEAKQRMRDAHVRRRMSKLNLETS